jgi:hypothetical protein
LLPERKGLCGFMAAAVRSSEWYSERLSVLEDCTDKLKQCWPEVCKAVAEISNMENGAASIEALCQLCRSATFWGNKIFHFLDPLLKGLEAKILATWVAIKRLHTEMKPNMLRYIHGMSDLALEASFVFPCFAEVQSMYEDIAEVLLSANQIALKNSVLLAVHAFNVGVAKKGPSTETQGYLRDVHEALASAHGASFKLDGDEDKGIATALANLEDVAIDNLGVEECQLALAARSEVARFAAVSPAGLARQAMLQGARELVQAMHAFQNAAADAGEITLGDKRLELLSVLEAKCARTKKHSVPPLVEGMSKLVTNVSNAQAECEDTVTRVRKQLLDTASARLREATASLAEVAHGGEDRWYAAWAEPAGYDELDKLATQALKAVSGKTLMSRIDTLVKAPLYARVWSSACV